MSQAESTLLNANALMQSLTARATKQAFDALYQADHIPDLGSFYLARLKKLQLDGKQVKTGCSSCGTAKPRQPMEHLDNLLLGYISTGLGGAERTVVSDDIDEPAHDLIDEYLRLSARNHVPKRDVFKLSPAYLRYYKSGAPMTDGDAGLLRISNVDLFRGNEAVKTLAKNATSGVVGLLNEMLYRYVQQMPDLKALCDLLPGPEPVFSQGKTR